MFVLHRLSDDETWICRLARDSQLGEMDEILVGKTSVLRGSRKGPYKDLEV